MGQDSTAEQNERPVALPVSETRPVKVCDSVEVSGDYRKEDKEEVDKLSELIKKHNAVVRKTLQLEEENSALRNQVEEISKKHEATEERQKAMEVKSTTVEGKNKTLRNHIPACFHQLELVEKGYYLRSPQPTQDTI
ncbi:hypothetical protein QBC36DRAFT_308639 [Triangularia setosa]|uniref:Uncharacterized protein n=1 Tax=Triangularia setosa TaxID=2587417 RepID=A0AAN6WEE5_9PEZI|nr:hypothetical protein QBC36DRAFT_308639 [Podospora setosa]